MKNKRNNSTIISTIRENSGLSSYLANLQRGRTATPHSWLYEKESAEITLQRWIPIMEKANSNSPFGDEFIQFDKAQLSKFGPQGAVPPVSDKACIDVIEPLFVSSHYDDELALKQYFPAAKEFAQKAFGRYIGTKRPKSINLVIDDMRARDTLTTNSGFPRFTRRNSVKDQEIQDALSGKAYDYPAILLFRQYNGKLRPVWMFPMSCNLIEFTFSEVIQDVLRITTSNPISPFYGYLSPWEGYEATKRALTRQWPKPRNIVGGDTTAMDAHMRPAQIRLVFEIVKWLFQKSYWDDLYKSMMWITRIPLLYSLQYSYVGTHGLASGSGWTQLTETVLQMFMSSFVATRGQGIGDDFYWICNLNADKLVEYLSRFGLPANPEKQTVSKNMLHFLQRMNHQNFFSREDSHVLGGYYPTIRALNSMLQPEKFHKPEDWNSDMFCIRNYMILENCIDDPCFDEFLKFVVSGHRDMIPFAKKTAKELAAIRSKARQIPGLNPTYNQEKLTKPLTDFVSINTAAKL